MPQATGCVASHSMESIDGSFSTQQMTTESLKVVGTCPGSEIGNLQLHKLCTGVSLCTQDLLNSMSVDRDQMQLDMRQCASSMRELQAMLRQLSGMNLKTCSVHATPKHQRLKSDKFRADRCACPPAIAALAKPSSSAATCTTTVPTQKERKCKSQKVKT